MAVTPDITTANFLAKLDQFRLGGAFVHDEEDVDLIKGIHRLHRDIFGISGSDANNEYLLHQPILHFPECRS
jgi:hypothetical protein